MEGLEKKDGKVRRERRGGRGEECRRIEENEIGQKEEGGRRVN